MKSTFEAQFAGWSFVAAGVMFWAGWMAMPAHLGTYFAPEDFERVHAHLRLWIWMYRVHIFGIVVTAVALLSLAALLADTRSRIMIWPGAGVATAGMFVSALAAAFYYHHGVWGAITLAGQGADAHQQFVAALRVDTEYVTCLVRFGRVFSGLGLLILGCGIIKFQVLPKWVGGMAALIGVAAMALTMSLPDNLHWYAPIFHALALWLILTGIALLRLPAVESAAA